MRENHKSCTKSMPTFMELEMMLKKLKLSQIKDTIQAQRDNEMEFSINQLVKKQRNDIFDEENSIIYDNFQDPNCFEEQIKAIDTIQLNRIIERKPMTNMTKQTNQPLTIVQKFKLYVSGENNKEPLSDLNTSRLKDKQAEDNTMCFESIQRSLDKSASRLSINRVSRNSKQNKKPEVNKQKKTIQQGTQKSKNRIFSKIQMHRFSDCQGLLRVIHKK